MGKLISVTVYGKGPTVYPSASPQAIQADMIKYATNATTSQKQANPAASTNINTVLWTNMNANNEGEDNSWLINESLATIVSNS